MFNKLNQLLEQTDLPIRHSFAAFLAAHQQSNVSLLQAPTGSGKTTMLPLLLLQQNMGKILVAVPRRIAAKNMALYLAKILDTKLGEIIGYNVKMEHQAGTNTQILFVSFGILERMLLQNPELPSYRHIIFDEFHERSVSNDFALALSLEIMAALRPDLHLTIMSASLDINNLQKFLPQAKLVQAQGRAYPIEIIYKPPATGRGISFNQHVVQTILTALGNYKGDILVFLPGAKEITQIAKLLEPKLPTNLELHKLHSSMSSESAAAIFTPSGQRRVILSSSIAESSLTLNNIGVVIDSGLSRRAIFAPQNSASYFITQKASLSSIQQRAGRAGRTQPGVAIRLWDEASNLSLEPFDSAEILQADLSKLMLDAAAYGVSDLSDLAFLSPPPKTLLVHAKATLLQCKAIENDGKITPHGKLLQALNLPIVLGNMVLYAGQKNCANEAALLALMLEELRFLNHIIDIPHRFELLLKSSSDLARKLRQAGGKFAKPNQANKLDAASQAELFLQACPSMLAKACGGGYYLLSNGSRAYLDPACALSNAEFLIAIKLSGAQGKQRIIAACAIDKQIIENSELIATEEQIFYDKATGKFRATAQKTIGAITLQQQQLPRPSQTEFSLLACALIRKEGLEALGHGTELAALLARLAWLQQHFSEFHPFIDIDYLQQETASWLQPYLARKQSFKELDWETLKSAIFNIWPYELVKQARMLAPATYRAPSDRQFTIDYSFDQPRISVKVQELYGTLTRAFIGGGKYPLQFELLSPARRPIQITDNIPNFWTSSWPAIAREMRARYPKHFWPINPLETPPYKKGTRPHL